jgi:hypothetical protein
MTFFSTASVRSIEAPSGIFTPGDQVQLVLHRDEAAGTALNISPPAPTSSSSA